MNSQMTIGKKISLLCGLLVAFTVLLGVVALFNMNRMETATQSIVGDSLPGVYSISRAESVLKDARGAMLTHLASSTQEEMAQMEASIAESQRTAKELFKAYEKTISRARDRELYEKIGPANDRWLAAWERPRTLSRAVRIRRRLRPFVRKLWLPSPNCKRP